MRVELTQVDGRRFRISARDVEVVVDDTVEAGGPGDGFRPTELLLGALAACMSGTMLNFARDQGIPVRGIDVVVTDEVEKAPTRIGRIAVEMRVAADATEKQIGQLQRVASACKIHTTLARPPEVDVAFTVEP